MAGLREPFDQSDVLEMGGMTLRPGDRVGPYVYRRPVGKGGMAHILLADDPSGKEVALKVLKASRISTGLARFKREFRALARLDHPGVIHVEAYGDVHGHPYIAMEYVPGKDLHQVIRGFRDQPLEEVHTRVERILVDLAQALAYIHKRGLVHRDLKPSNVLVDGEGRCKLTDFGIVKELDPKNDPFVSTTLVGTWAYASPEQIMGQPLDHRADLYSLGIILYAMLTGRRPFVAKDMAGYLEQHRDHRPVPPRQIEATIPEHLEDICMRLLQKAPRDRFRSAQEILFQLEEISPEDHDGSPTDEKVWEPSLVGRQEAVDQLRDAVNALTRREGGVVMIEGAEGVGRTRLFDVALEHARIVGIPVHAVRMGPAEGSFDALLELTEQIGRELGARRPAELQAALRSFVKGKGRLAGDLRYQLYDGVRDALSTLLEEGPHVIAVDDVHNASAPLVAMLGYLVRSVIVRDNLPLLVLLTARTDKPAPALDAFRDGSELGLAPLRIPLAALSLAEVTRLVEGLLGPGTRARSLGERLHGETDGNPFFVSEFLRSLIARGTVGEAGRLAADPEATEIAARDMEIPPGVRQVVQQRLAGLGALDRELVRLVAVAGGEVDLDVLLDVLEGQDEDAVLDRLDALVDQGLLSERRSGLQTWLGFRQRKVGDVVYRGLVKPMRQSLHRRMAKTLELRHKGSPVGAEAVGNHFARAGDPAKAYRYLVQAAFGLWERSVLAEAWDMAERAFELEGDAQTELPPPEFDRWRLDLCQVQAAVLYNRGEWQPAHAALTELQERAEAVGNLKVAARAALEISTCLRRLDRTAEGVSLLSKVLSAARKRHDRGTIIDALHGLAAAAWEQGDLGECERLASQGLIAATGPELVEKRARILIALSIVQASRGQLAAATAGLSEAEGILRNLRDKRTRALVLANLAELLTWQGEVASAVRRATDAIGLCKDVLYRSGECFAHRVRAEALMDAGALDDAAKDLRRALSLCSEMGLSEDMLATRFASGRLAVLQGETERALVHLRAGVRVAGEGDPENYLPLVQAVLCRAQAYAGEGQRARTMLEDLELRVGDLHLPRRTQTWLFMAEAWSTLDQREQALASARKAAQAAGTRGFRTWAIRARLLVASHALGAEARAAREEARELASDLAASLPAELAESWRRSPGIASLLAGR